MKILGVMSGTSLDGLDLVLAEFQGIEPPFSYQIIKSESIAYSKEWMQRLSNAVELSGLELRALDVDFGKFIGKTIKQFLGEEKIDFVASHGHTIFHEPERGFTMQIGDNQYTHAACSWPVLADFRSLDMALGGQGAPLVAIGDLLLFQEYSACLNLGGIANISYQENGKRLAFDVCPFNILLNYFAQKLGQPFDDEGKMAKKSKVNSSLLAQLNQLEYYHQKGPKTLDKLQVLRNYLPVIEKQTIDNKEILASLVAHYAQQISSVLPKEGEVLVTGGGSYNKYFIKTLQSVSKVKIVVPSNELIEGKEALLFAFLGYLKFIGKDNVLASATGALRDSSSGTWVGNIKL